MELKVIDFLRENPKARKCDVIKGTGLDKKTVYKYYEAAKEKASVEHAEPTAAAGTDRATDHIMINDGSGVQTMGRIKRK